MKMSAPELHTLRHAAPDFAWSTKAGTLLALRERLRTAALPACWSVTLSQWQRDPAAVVREVGRRWPTQPIAVRSSALFEDTQSDSAAGAYLSRLHVPAHDAAQVHDAAQAVAASMPGVSGDEILFQTMVAPVSACGVVMTFDIANGAPYYVISYDDESGRTDQVTGGQGLHKTVLVYRGADAALLKSARMRAVVELARELEMLTRCQTLDIEFAIDLQGGIHLLQVRRIAAARHWHPVTERRVARQLEQAERFVSERSLPRPGLMGRRTLLAMMPDWNPAEIIGITPRPLATSLYRELITFSSWREARASMGYREVAGEELMVLLNHHPYVDVRNSFNSFVPAAVPDDLAAAAVDAWLDRLDACPEHHDKVEFEIVPTCRDFAFDQHWQQRYPGLFNANELDIWREALGTLTLACLRPAADGPYARALHAIDRLDALSREAAPRHVPVTLDQLAATLDLCRRQGALPFAVIARHAFMAEALLRSAVERGALTAERVSQWRTTVRTVTGDMLLHYREVCQGRRSRTEFLQVYGHLRPGTYEITSERYDQREGLFQNDATFPELATPGDFQLSADESRALDALLREARFEGVDAQALLAFAREAIEGRERAKFVFSRQLSNFLRGLAAWGERTGLHREDLSFLPWPLLHSASLQPIMDDPDRYFLDEANRHRQRFEAAHAFRLSHIIRDERDIQVATLNRSEPNFFGRGLVRAPVICVDRNTPASTPLAGLVVCIESADPGYDWIFSRAPAALVTQFGGTNSHMAVRCAELGLPAAIGCGEPLFRRLVTARTLELSCEERWIRPLQESTR